jgi:transposase
MTPPLVYLGLDVAKASLAGHLCGTGFELANDAAGHAALLARIAAHGGAVHVICEATGGYERPVVAALRAAAVPVSVLHPTRARKLADGLGFLAKTDAIDAAALAAIGPKLQPPATPAPAPGQERLAALVCRRDQLCELARREKQHRETTKDKALLRDLDQNLASLKKRIAKIESLIADHIASHPALDSKARRLLALPGVGPVCAASMLAFLPELGHGSRSQIASLSGLAPRNRDSGAFRGQRHVHGGRPKVRRILYLCSLSACQYHPQLKFFYRRLIANGKAPKLALIATARKLLLLLHSALKNPNFSIA